MATVKSPLSDDALKVTGDALQRSLIDLIDLALVSKQAHWNITGRNFKSVHEQLDEVVAFARKYQDRVAERAVAIGLNPDGRARTLADRTALPQLELGYLADDKVVSALSDVLGQLIARFRERVESTEKPDPVTQDLLIDITAKLEKHRWMFTVQH
ncbi:DNA starvation/stationary phase protection protein [Actinomadura craniellae]|uniref:DNA starvation/stationary phase protection protein n=1 Tax=Actinomadura craniellae TaxID=2231787 RepID=A0A365GZ74_9ACTN|nr:DNA starvation/stationary phase protection protein [Actinomadura craniellae]